MDNDLVIRTHSIIRGPEGEEWDLDLDWPVEIADQILFVDVVRSCEKLVVHHKGGDTTTYTVT